MGSRLSKATNVARKGLIVFLIFAISTFLFRFLFGITESTSSAVKPTPVPKSPYIVANQKLGKIPYPQKPSLPLNTESNPTYSILDQAVLPEFPEVFNVYVINKPREKLGNASKGPRVASNLKLDTNGRVIADNTTLWQSEDTIRSLTYNKLLEHWDYRTDLTKENFNQEITTNLKLSTIPGFYDNKGVEILNLLSLSDSYFAKAGSRVSYINLDTKTDTISSATSPKLAKFVYIRQNKKILTSELDPNYKPTKGEIALTNLESEVRVPDYNSGVVNIIARGSIEGLVPDLVNFQYNQLNYGDRGIYQSLNSKDAFLKLQSGEGILYWLNLKGEDPLSEHKPLSILEFKINAQKTAIVYMEPEAWEESLPWTNFLQPYYLFEGDAILTDGREANFATLLPALLEKEYLK